MKKKFFLTKWKYNILKLWNEAKVELKGKFMILSAYIRKEERSKISNLSFHLDIEKLKTAEKRSKFKQQQWNKKGARSHRVIESRQYGSRICVLN